MDLVTAPPLPPPGKSTTTPPAKKAAATKKRRKDEEPKARTSPMTKDGKVRVCDERGDDAKDYHSAY